MQPLDYVGDYVNRRWAVIPLVRGTKQPAVRFKHLSDSDGPFGLACTRELWHSAPDAGIGVLLRPSRLFVVDADSLQAVQEVIRRTKESCANVVQTAKGAHFYYSRPDDCPPLRTIKRGESGAIDILADGFVAAPPSIHKSGFCYRWVRSGPLQPPPAWAVDMLKTIRERSIASKFLDPDDVKGAFPNTSAEAIDLLSAINCVNPAVANALFDTQAATAFCSDRSRALWVTINTLIRVLGTDRGRMNDARIRLIKTMGPLSDESIAKVVWYGTLGCDIIGAKPRQKGWGWFCDEIARARLEVVGG